MGIMKVLLLLAGLCCWAANGSSVPKVLESDNDFKEDVVEPDTDGDVPVMTTALTTAPPVDTTACLFLPCRNGGLCLPIGIFNYRCLCPPRFTGKKCLYRRCLPPFWRICLSPFRTCAIVRGLPLCVCYDRDLCPRPPGAPDNDEEGYDDDEF